MEIKTHEDGWDCIPELREAVEDLEAIDTFKYEIKNCVRASNMEYMVAEMKAHLQVAMDELDDAMVCEYVTVEEEDY